MKARIETYSSAYELDRIVGRKAIVALTRKNADFLNAVVRIDSRYSKVFNYNNENVIKNLFDKMQSGGEFEGLVFDAISEIDRTNSTHLEAAVDGRKIMADRVCEICRNIDNLKDELQKEFSVQNNNHILARLTDKIQAKKEGGFRYNLSFASKFCSYAAEFLNIGKKYSKYDNVVATALPDYSKIYLGIAMKRGTFLIQQYHKNEDELQYRLEIYEKYCNCIDSIIATLKEDNIDISKDEFDHIVWYSSK